MLGAAFAAPASGSAPLTQRETLTRSVGGYKTRLPYEAPHEMQLSCVDLDPDEHNENAQCVICLDNVEERGDIDVLVMDCGHWVCASIDCRPKRNSKWNQRIGMDEEVDLECPRCCYLLEPGHEKMRLARKRVLRFPFCVGRPSEPPNYLGRDKRDPDTDGGGGNPFARAPRLTLSVTSVQSSPSSSPRSSAPSAPSALRLRLRPTATTHRTQPTCRQASQSRCIHRRDYQVRDCSLASSPSHGSQRAELFAFNISTVSVQGTECRHGYELANAIRVPQRLKRTSSTVP